MNEMLEIPEEVKAINHLNEVILIDLRTSVFMKIHRAGWEFIHRYITNKEDKGLLEQLKEEDRRKFFIFLEDLKKKNYLRDKSPGDPGNDQTEDESKSKFINNKRTAYFGVTNKCNLKCRFCYASPHYSTETVPGDLENTKKILDRAKEINVENMIITGGEPLLREDVFDVLSYAGKVIPNVVLTTNGTLLDEAAAEQLKNSGVDVVSISIESSTKKIHDELRGEGTFEKSMKAIENLKKAGFDRESLNITATLNRKNIHELHTFRQFADQLGVKMNFSLYQTVGRGKINDQLAFTEEQLIGFFMNTIKSQMEDTDLEIEDFTDRVTFNKSTGRLVPMIKNHCGMVANMLGIKANGDLVPCHLFFSTRDPGLIIGNILETDILEKMWRFFKGIPVIDKKDGCKECSVRYFCGGSCYAGGYFCDGSFYTPNPSCLPLKKYYSTLMESLGKPDETTYLFEKLGKFIN